MREQQVGDHRVERDVKEAMVEARKEQPSHRFDPITYAHRPTQPGGVAERLNAAALKAVRPRKGSRRVGSPPSAERADYRFFLISLIVFCFLFEVPPVGVSATLTFNFTVPVRFSLRRAFPVDLINNVTGPGAATGFTNVALARRPVVPRTRPSR